MGIFSFFKKPGAAELIAKGCALLQRGELDAAFDKMKAAAEVAPAEAAPLAWMADIVARKLYEADPAEVQQIYVYAHALAQEALDRDDNEDRALAVLGRLARLRQRPAQTSGPAADSAVSMGNQLFGKGRWEDAQRCYEEASRAEPELAEPVKLAGNCQFAMARRAEGTTAARHFAAAEQAFRRAVELDPGDAQAHHFLADAYLAQSRKQDALEAAMASIEANPAYYPAWQVVRAIRQSQGRPLRSFRIRPGAFVSMGEDGKPSVSIRPTAGGPQEAAVWMVYAMVKAGLVESDVEAATGSIPFTAELRGFRAAFKMIKEAPSQGEASEGPVVLTELCAMDEEGDLPTALLLLAYDESYRDDLEALKRARPSMCADFVNRRGLRPF